MKSLIKIFLLLLTVFLVLTVSVIILTGGINADQIEGWLESASAISPVYIGLTVAGLLFADLFIAVPTLTICILSGYFLGFPLGAAFSLLGVGLAGTGGYLITHSYGRGLLHVIERNPEKVQEMEEIFRKDGVLVILLSRALPILPEISACLSGLTRMPALKFFTAWFCSSIPYVAIAAYAGSTSTLGSPLPAILTVVGLYLFFWIMWIIFIRRNQKLRRPLAVERADNG